MGSTTHLTKQSTIMHKGSSWNKRKDIIRVSLESTMSQMIPLATIL